jgi:hypothetical protein
MSSSTGAVFDLANGMNVLDDDAHCVPGFAITADVMQISVAPEVHPTIGERGNVVPLNLGVEERTTHWSRSSRSAELKPSTMARTVSTFSCDIRLRSIAQARRD